MTNDKRDRTPEPDTFTKFSYFVVGDLQNPGSLIRFSWATGAERYSPTARNRDRWVDDHDVGHWILDGDTILTRITPEQAKAQMASGRWSYLWR